MSQNVIQPILERLGILDGNEWLIKKLDLHRRRVDHFQYMSRHFSFDIRGATFVDLGPGTGESLEIAQSLGATAIGIDAASGEGGMGDPYLAVCREIVKSRNLDVRRVGALAIDRELKQESVDFINSRGSIEQILCKWMRGEPHHIHQNCNLMHWKSNCHLGIGSFLEKCAKVLKPGGSLLIHANGAANTEVYDLALIGQAARYKFRIKKHEDRLHRLTLG